MLQIKVLMLYQKISCEFSVALLRFFAGHLCCDATHIDDSSILESREVKQVNKFDHNGEVFMDEKVEKGMLAFSFKYQRPSFGENIEEIEEELQVYEIESKTILEKEDQPYLNFGRFFSEKILSGFTKEHVAKDGSSLDEMLYVSCGDATIRRSEVDQEALMSEKTIYYLVNEFYGYYYSGDSLKDVEKKQENDNVITSEMSRDIMEEAIEVIWKFVKAEKHETPILIKLLTENNVKIQDPSDYKLMKKIQL